MMVYHHSCPKGHTNSQESLVLKTFFFNQSQNKKLIKDLQFWKCAGEEWHIHQPLLWWFEGDHRGKKRMTLDQLHPKLSIQPNLPCITSSVIINTKPQKSVMWVWILLLRDQVSTFITHIRYTHNNFPHCKCNFLFIKSHTWTFPFCIMLWFSLPLRVCVCVCCVWIISPLEPPSRLF